MTITIRLNAIVAMAQWASTNLKCVKSVISSCASNAMQKCSMHLCDARPVPFHHIASSAIICYFVLRAWRKRRHLRVTPTVFKHSFHCCFLSGWMAQSGPNRINRLWRQDHRWLAWHGNSSAALLWSCLAVGLAVAGG